MEGMKYKIGDVARILGISTDLLRYYEKRAVVRPVKDKANDYRYYEAWDINFLMDCLWMKGFGFGIEEIGHMVTSCPYDELLERFRRKEGDLTEELKWKGLVLRRIRRHHREVAARPGLCGQVRPAAQPGDGPLPQPAQLCLRLQPGAGRPEPGVAAIYAFGPPLL